MNTIDLEVQGMSCGACVKHVTQALQATTSGPVGLPAATVPKSTACHGGKAGGCGCNGG